MESDLELLGRWCDGDKQAGSDLFARHFDVVYGFFARKVEDEAEELVQDTFVACVHSRDAFRQQSSFRTYLFAIARNLLYAYWRRRGVRGHAIDFQEVSLTDLATSIGTHLERDQDRKLLLAALQRLPLDDQLLLEMFYWENMDSAELGEVFELAPASVRSRLHRARQVLRSELSLEGPAEIETSVTSLDSWARRLRPDRSSSRPR